MIRVYHDPAWLSLFVGSQDDERAITNPDEWAIIHAAKEPYPEGPWQGGDDEQSDTGSRRRFTEGVL